MPAECVQSGIRELVRDPHDRLDLLDRLRHDDRGGRVVVPGRERERVAELVEVLLRGQHPLGAKSRRELLYGTLEIRLRHSRRQRVCPSVAKLRHGSHLNTRATLGQALDARVRRPPRPARRGAWPSLLAAGSRPAAAAMPKRRSISPQMPRGSNSENSTAATPRPTRYQTPVPPNQVSIEEEDDRARGSAPSKVPDAADEHHEDHVGGPLHGEVGLGLEGDGGGQPQRAGHAARRRRRARRCSRLVPRTRTPTEAAASSLSRMAWIAAPTRLRSRTKSMPRSAPHRASASQ